MSSKRLQRVLESTQKLIDDEQLAGTVTLIARNGKAVEPLIPGSFGWGGASGTDFWVDPAEKMQANVMPQITRHRHPKFRYMLSELATQAVAESYRHQPPLVMGYEKKQPTSANH